MGFFSVASVLAPAVASVAGSVLGKSSSKSNKKAATKIKQAEQIKAESEAARAREAQKAELDLERARQKSSDARFDRIFDLLPFAAGGIVIVMLLRK